MTAPAEFYERLWKGGAGAENAARWTFQEDLVARALTRLAPKPGCVVLEIGPGVGGESAKLARAGARVVAIDITTAALVRTRESGGPSVAPVQAAAEALPLVAGSIDCVFAQTVLMHLDLPKAAAEWTRVLRPGGRIVVVEPLAGNPLVGLYRRLLSPYRETHPRYITLADLRGASPTLVVTHHEEHYLLEVAALALPTALRGPARRVLAALDRMLFALPGVGRMAWMTLVELERR